MHSLTSRGNAAVKHAKTNIFCPKDRGRKSQSAYFVRNKERLTPSQIGIIFHNLSKIIYRRVYFEASNA